MRPWPAIVVLCSTSCLGIAGLDGDFVGGDPGAAANGPTTSSEPSGGHAGTTTTSSTSTLPAGGSAGASPSSTTGSGTGGAGGVETTTTSSASGGAAGAGGDPGPVCGDGTQEGDEACDDGGTDPLDGCSPSCTVEDPDDCDAAPVIVLGTGTTETITGDLAGADDDVQNSTGAGECSAGSAAGADHVWAVAPTADGWLEATLDASYSNHWMQIRAACPGDTTLQCAWDPNDWVADAFGLAVTGGTTYYLIVDSYGGSTGSYTLSVSLY